MGFKSSPVPSLVHSVVTLFLVSELLWMQGVVVVNGALEESDSQEHTPFYESHNHINEHDHFHEDGYCDCNSQGPWRPLFKPSQADLPDPESLHHLANQLHDSQEQLHDLPNDLHPTIHSGDRQAKKQNHMIHLHLIPHIYVPVVHPVQYSVYENNHDHSKPDPEQTHNFHTTESSASGEHFSDHSHSQEQHDQQHFYNHDNHLNLPNHQDQHDHFYNQDNHLNVANHQSYGGDPHQQYDFSEQNHHHESGELNNVHNAHNGFYYPQHSEEHQYQVHEEGNRDPFYGNYATGSSDNTHVLPINNNLNYFLPKNKFADRSRYNKRFLDFSNTMLRLGVMRPPALGQKNTWLMNFPEHNVPLFPKSVFDSKSVFDFKPYAVKAPVFDFKPFIKPNVIPPVLPATKLVQTPVVPMNNFLQTPVMPINKLLPAPVVVYPTEIKKRVDKVKPKN